MFEINWTLIILAATAVATWFLTGLDKTTGGESKQDHHLTRAIRSVLVVFLVWVLICGAHGQLGSAGGSFIIFASIGIGLILRSSLSELFTHGFLGFLDPSLHDHREIDLNRAQRFQDTIARLIHTGKHDEAIRLCETLKHSGEIPLATLEHTLEYLGVKQNRSLPKPLHEASQLRQAGDFTGAEQRLKAMLARNPCDEGAAIMLMRLYAEDLHQPELAHKVLLALEKQPHFPASHLEFARRSIEGWNRTKVSSAAVASQPATFDELIEQGSLGTAVELLEQQIKEKPGDFNLQLKLAEVYATRCKYTAKAEKIIRQIELSPAYNAAQIAQAREKLREWNSAAGHHDGVA
jgi:thioredoxin-like negative regulator of GroEL